MNYKRPSLFKNYLYNFSSQLLGILLPMVTAPYLARILREEGNGQIAFTNSIVAYFVAFAGFGFSLYGQREIAKYKNDKAETHRIFIEIFLLKVIFGIIALTTLIILVVSPLISKQYKTLVLINSLQVVSAIFDIQFYYQGIEDFKSIAIRTIIIRLLSIICVFIFVKDQGDVWLYLLYSSLVGLFANLIMWPSVLKELKQVRPNIYSLMQHIRPSFYIFLPILSGTIFSVLDSTMIGYMASNPEYENGCYGSALKLINIISVVIMADGQVLASRNASDYARRDFESLKAHIELGFRYVGFIGFPIILGLIALSGRISRCFFGSGFEKVPLLLDIFTVRVLTHGVMNVIGNQYLLPTGREKVCTRINFLGIMANAVINALLIPIYGCIGAAIASIIAEVLLVIMYLQYFIAEHKYWNIKLVLQCAKYLAASFIMFIPTYYFNSRLKDRFIYLFILIIVGTAIYGISLLVLKDSFTIKYLNKVISRGKRNKSNVS